MGQTFTQNQAGEMIVVLSKDESPVTGLTNTDLTAEIRKDGDASFTAKSLTAGDVTDIGSGVYAIALTTAELDTLGTFILKLTGADIDQHVALATVVEADETLTTVSLETCVLTGHVFDPAGKPVVGAAVSARMVGLPSVEQSAAVVTDSRVAVKTDVNGEFFLELARLADVEVFIPSANYRRRLVVPNKASVNLFTEVA